MADAKKLYERPTVLSSIKRILALPCNLDGTAYIELAVDALVEMAIEVASPDPKELYHHVVGEPIVHSFRGALQDAARVKKLENSRVVRAIGTGLGIYDQVVWYIFLFYALDDSLIDSMSQFLRFDPCGTNERPGDGVAWISALYADGRDGNAIFQFNPGSKYYPVRAATTRLSALNNWQATMACSTKWKINEFNEVPVQGRLIFKPDDLSPSFTFDDFTNHRLDDVGPPETTNQWNHLFAHVQAPGRRDGELVAVYNWHRPDAPPLAECFLAAESHCFISGG